MNGKGTIIYANGTKYIGEWHSGVIHGLGTITFPNGVVQSGLWNNRKFVAKKKVPGYSCRGKKCFTIEDIQKGIQNSQDPKKQDSSTTSPTVPLPIKKSIDPSIKTKLSPIQLGLIPSASKNQTPDNKQSAISVQKENPLTKRDYYALIIGNSDYVNLPKLENATKKAREISTVLVKHFGFKTRLLLNAKKDHIRKALDLLKDQLEANDSLLIYYIGYKEYNETDKKIYWLPIDAENEYPLFTDSQWINGDEIKIRLTDISSKHILVLGSVFSNIWKRKTMAKQPPDHLRIKSLLKLDQLRSRTIITNKQLGDVSDKNDKLQTQFADAFLTGLLKIPKDIFSIEELYIQHFQSSKALKKQPLFEYGVFEKPKQQMGAFIFNRVKK